VTTGYYIYGFVDLIMAIAMIGVLISGVVKVKEVKIFFIIFMVSYIPNVLMFLV
jgi:hypothetical protein